MILHHGTEDTLRPRPSRSGGERGSALVLVLLATLVVTALCTSLLMMSNTDHVIAGNERDAERALLASEAGLSYGFNLFRAGTLKPTEAGASFRSDADSGSPVNTGLAGGVFTGKAYDLSSSSGQGSLYRLVSTGKYRKANRTTEMVFQIVPDAFRFGYMAFNEATLHNHSGLAGPTFKIQSTVFSNNTVSIPSGITIDGSIVAAGSVSTSSGSKITGDVFAYSVNNGGTIVGDARTVCAITNAVGAADVTDNLSKQYDWYSGRSNPGAVGGSGTVQGTKDTYKVQNGDEFRYSIFSRNGTLMSDPNVNVVKYIAPPLIDYKAMKTEADKNDATYFTSMSACMTYLASKRVTEVVDGKSIKTMKVGTVELPEMIYVRGNFTLQLLGGSGSDSISSGKIAADGLHLEGGIYCSGDFSFNGPAYDPTKHPAGYRQLEIHALEHCFPAILAYPEPSTGTVDTWTPSNTPALGNGSITNSSKTSPHEGFQYIHGITFSGGDTHCHHTKSASELIIFDGAELGYKLHNCDYFQFRYDPGVRCTRFLVADGGVPQVVSFRETR